MDDDEIRYPSEIEDELVETDDDDDEEEQDDEEREDVQF